MRVNQLGGWGHLGNVLVGLGILCALAVPAQAGGATVVPATPVPLTAPSFDAQGASGAAASLLGLLDGADAFELNAAVLAQYEAQGMLPDGTVARIRQARLAGPAIGALGPPLLVYRDATAFCDTNGDGHAEVLVNDYSLVTSRPSVRLLDGRTGDEIYVEAQQFWFAGFVPQDTRAADPVPLREQAPRNLQPFRDLDGDGVCDFFTHSFTTTGDLAVAVLIQGTLTAHRGGAPASVIWQAGYDGIYVAASLPFSIVQCIELQGFPTGMLAFDSPVGPRLLFKTSDLHGCTATVPDPTDLIGEVRPRNDWSADHLTLYNGSTGAVLWTRDLDFSTSANRTNFTWISGVGQLDASTPEFEVVLDQMWVANPRSNQERDNPTDGSPLFRNGRGMDMLALRGDTGLTLWATPIWDDLAARVNPPQQEEDFEEMRQTHGYVIGDLNGDGLDEAMALVLAQEGKAATTVNGAYRTHFVPLDGADGERLWGTVRYQGWGHAQALHGPDGTLVGIGTMDVPTEVPLQARFPPKDLRLAVLDANDGTPRWTYADQFPQDSYLGYDLALQQYRNSLSVGDVDGDGWPDLITPGRYVQPGAGQQVLLSQSTQRFDVHSTMTGKTVASLTAFGSNGIALPCGDAVAVVGGNPGHLEAHAYALPRLRESWEAVLFLDPSPVSATAGLDMTFLQARCQQTADNRTFVAANAGLYSQKRGNEIIAPLGYPHADQRSANGTFAVWMTPDHLASGDLLGKLAALLQEPAPPTTADRVAWGAGPAIPGLLLGALVGAVRNRRAPLPPKPKVPDLPDLYGGA